MSTKALKAEPWWPILQEEHTGRTALTHRERLFFWFYAGECRLKASESAEKAGYKWAGVVGSRLKSKYPKTVAAIEAQVRRKLKLQPEEIEEHLSDIARDAHHKDRFRALELAAKMHGMTSDKLQITMTRGQLLRAVDEEIAAIMAAERTSEVADDVDGLTESEISGSQDELVTPDSSRSQ